MNMGYSTKGLLGILIALQLGLCGFVLIVTWCGPIRGFFVAVGAIAVACAFFVVIHYTHRSVCKKHNIIVNEKFDQR